MQTPSLFAVLFLGFAVGIAFTQDYDVVPLEQRSAGELARFYIEHCEANMEDLHGNDLIDEKIRLAHLVVDHPELEDKVDLSIEQFCDLVLQTLLNDYKKLTPSQLADEKTFWLDAIKKEFFD